MNAFTRPAPSAPPPEHEHDDWDHHWSVYNEATEQNPAQRFRRRAILRLLDVRDPGARIFDIGSGQGDLVGALSKAYPRAQITGLEYSRSGVEISRLKVPSAVFLHRDLTLSGRPPAERTQWATHAVCSEVLEHVDDPRLLLLNAMAYCQSGCRLVITVPGGPMSAFDRHIGHRRHYDVISLTHLLESAGLIVETSFTLGFPFFNLYRLAVIVRGERLNADVSSEPGRRRCAMGAMTSAFRLLLSMNPPVRRFGWQIVAVALVPARGVR